jgi:hypothetical protein
MKPVVVAAFACLAATGALAEAPACNGQRAEFRAALRGFTEAEARVNQARQSGGLPQDVRRQVTDEAIRRAGRVVDLATVMQRGKCLGFNNKPGDWSTVIRTTNDAMASFGRFGAEPDRVQTAGRGVIPEAPPPPPAAPQPAPRTGSGWNFLPSAISSAPEAAPAAPQAAPVQQQANAAPAEAAPGPRAASCVRLREEPGQGALDQYLVNDCDYAVHVKLCMLWPEAGKKSNQFECGTKKVFSTGNRPIEAGYQRKVASTVDPFRWLLNRCNASEDPACVPRMPGQAQ